MSTTTHTVTVSASVYRRLKELAGATSTSVDDLADDMLQHALPPTLNQVPERYQTDLYQLVRMNNDMLWQIVRSELNPYAVRQYQELLKSNTNRDLSAMEQAQLEMLREEADLLMMRRSYALLLLKRRGQNVLDWEKSDMDK